MKLIAQIRYSIRILLDLAMHQGKEVVRISDIASRQHISKKYLEKLIYTFKKAGLVVSKRGRNGGHALARTPETITLAQIIQVFDKHHIKMNGYKIQNGYSGYQDTLISHAWEEAKQAFYNRLEKVTLAHLSIDTTKLSWLDSDILVL